MSRICLVNALFPPDAHGGAESYVLRAARTLREWGHDVTVLTSSPYDSSDLIHPRRTTYEGIPIWKFFPLDLSHRSEGTGRIVLEKGLWHVVDALNPQAARAVSWVLDRIDPDIVHTNNLMGISTAAAKAIQRHDVRHVHTLHDYSLICPKSNLLRDLTAPDDDLVVCEDAPTPCRLFAGAKRRLVGTPDVVTAPSQHIIDVHRKHGLFHDIDCTRIPLGAETVVDRPQDTSGHPSVLYVGKQLRSKELDVLFEAAEILSDVDFHVRVGTLVGYVGRRATI